MKPIKIYSDTIDKEALDQFSSAMDQDFSVRGALMADAHKGYAMPIGGVIATQGVVVPAWIGFDIGCGMCALPLEAVKKEDIIGSSEEIFNSIYRSIPVGFAHNQKHTEWDYEQYEMTSEFRKRFEDEGKNHGLRQLGSLGSGNHFIEIGYDEEDRVWVIIHSGSRGIGHATATYYMKLASNSNKAKEDHYGLKVSSDAGQEYIADMNFCLEFALQNRREMMARVIKEIKYYCGDFNYRWESLINRNHNHAEHKDEFWIHRKGATHAELGLMGVIPGNMRDGSFIVRGKGNPESLWSSSHGAGRVLGRKEARRTLTLEYFERAMDGIVAKVDSSTLEESPLAYKDIWQVMAEQRALVEIVHYIKPLVNIKA